MQINVIGQGVNVAWDRLSVCFGRLSQSTVNEYRYLWIIVLEV